MTCVLLGTGSSVQPQDRDPPQALKDFPFQIYLSPPFNSILESPFWPADDPSILPLISPESTYSQLCPELSGLLHHPLPEAEAPHLPPAWAGNNPNPLCSHTPVQLRPFILGSGWQPLWQPQVCGGTSAPGTLGFPECRCPWMWPPSAPCGWWPCRHRCCDSSVASWAPFLPGCPG